MTGTGWFVHHLSVRRWPAVSLPADDSRETKKTEEPKEEKKRVGSAVLGGRMGGLTSEENYGRCGEQARYAGLLFSAALALLEKLKVDSRFCPGESWQISNDQSFSFHRLIHDSWPEIGPGYIFFLALFD